MIFRKVILVPGKTVAAAAWLLPDGSLVSVRMTQDEWEKGHPMETEIGKPDPDALFVFGCGGMPALDTVDGHPSAGDCWEVDTIDEQTGKSITVLHIQTGDDSMGEWSFSRDSKWQFARSHRTQLKSYDLMNPEVTPTLAFAPAPTEFVKAS